MNILETIVKDKIMELEKAKTKCSLEELRKLASERVNSTSRRRFSSIFRSNYLALIAEVKLKSPSKGVLTNKTHIEIASMYAKSDVDAISVLTETKYFNGQLSYLEDVRNIAPQPILRKDFIIDEYQVYETLIAGADAFLLIASILGLSQLKNLVRLGKRLGLESLVEIHNQDDLEKALAVGAEIIGINNRDLASLKTDLQTSVVLMPKIPQGKFVVSESGIESTKDAKLLKSLHVYGVLVGSSIIESNDPVGFISQLKSV